MRKYQVTNFVLDHNVEVNFQTKIENDCINQIIEIWTLFSYFVIEEQYYHEKMRKLGRNNMNLTTQKNKSFLILRQQFHFCIENNNIYITIMITLKFSNVIYKSTKQNKRINHISFGSLCVIHKIQMKIKT